jgi:hypothetical protein
VLPHWAATALLANETNADNTAAITIVNCTPLGIGNSRHTLLFSQVTLEARHHAGRPNEMISAASLTADVPNYRLSALVDMHMLDPHDLGAAIAQPAQRFELGSKCLHQASRRGGHDCRVSARSTAAAQHAEDGPRVRERGGTELELPSWTAIQEADLLSRWAFNQMLIGVATRKYARSVRPLRGWRCDGLEPSCWKPRRVSGA